MSVIFLGMAGPPSTARVQAELAHIVDDLDAIEQTLDAGPPGRPDLPLADALRRLVAASETCEHLLEDHATGARIVDEDTLHMVAMVLHAMRGLIVRLIAVER